MLATSIFKLTNTIIISKNKNVEQLLKKFPVKEVLEKRQHVFVVAQIYKLASNVSFICKGFYTNTLCKEFGVIATLVKRTNFLMNPTVNEIKQQGVSNTM